MKRFAFAISLLESQAKMRGVWADEHFSRIDGTSDLVAAADRNAGHLKQGKALKAAQQELLEVIEILKFIGSQ